MFVKRTIDFVLSLIAIVIISPVFLIVAILVRIKLGRPVFFKQERPGKNEKLFKLYKFRSMTDEKDEEGILLPDSVRLTSFGRTLRSTSLDELPELFNILKGDMSIVGPRPLAVKYIPYYNEEEKKRHTVLPGLTGLAQVHGRNATTWEDRFSYDIEYVQNISFLLDVRILIETIKVVFTRKGIGERGIDSPIDFDEYRKEQIEKDGANHH